MADPSVDALAEFLAERRNLILAGTRADGRPHVNPNWFHWDGGSCRSYQQAEFPVVIPSGPSADLWEGFK
jgi:hypothetical protein